MNIAAFDEAARVQLGRLSSTLGGAWAFAEPVELGLRAVATDPALAAELNGHDWAAVLRRAETDGVVVRPVRPASPVPFLGLEAVEPGGEPPGGNGRDEGADRGAGRERGAGEPDRPAVARVLVGDGLSGGPPGPTERSLLEIVADAMAAMAEVSEFAAESCRRAEKLELRASTDPLTGLLNRRGWDRVLAREQGLCRRHGLSAEVVVVDLDGLKELNDAYGHEAGDAMIMRAATYIFSAVRAHDSVCRLGGDEFVVLAVGAEGEGLPVGARVDLILQEADIAASVGSALSQGSDASLIDAWRTADLRMYRAKQRRRSSGTSAVAADEVAADELAADGLSADDRLADGDAPSTGELAQSTRRHVRPAGAARSTGAGAPGTERSGALVPPSPEPGPNEPSSPWAARSMRASLVAVPARDEPDAPSQHSHDRSADTSIEVRGRRRRTSP